MANLIEGVLDRDHSGSIEFGEMWPLSVGILAVLGVMRVVTSKSFGQFMDGMKNMH